MVAEPTGGPRSQLGAETLPWQGVSGARVGEAVWFLGHRPSRPWSRGEGGAVTELGGFLEARGQ